MTMGADGNLAVLSLAPNSKPDGHAYFFKIDPKNGAVLWGRQFRGIGSYIPASNNPFALGYIRQTPDNGYLLAFTAGYDGSILEGTYLIKTDRNGLTSCPASSPVTVRVDDRTADWYYIDTLPTISAVGGALPVTGNEQLLMSIVRPLDSTAFVCPIFAPCNGLNAGIFINKTTLCQNEPLSISSTSTGYTALSWLINGQNANPATYAFGVGTHTIKLIATNGAFSSEIERTIRISSPANASFSYAISNATPKIYACAQFTPSVFDDCLEYKWNFGDGTVGYDRAPNHHFTQIGTYNVCYKVTNVCSTVDFCQPVTVNCPLQAPIVNNIALLPSTSGTLTVTNPTSLGEVCWYNVAANGTPLAIGNTYTVPNNLPIGNHRFYVERVEKFESSVGYTYPQVQNNQVLGWSSVAQGFLKIPYTLRLKSLDLRLVTSDSVTIQVIKTADNTIYQTPYFFAAGNATTTIPINFLLNQGEYRFWITAKTNVNTFLGYSITTNPQILATPSGDITFTNGGLMASIFRVVLDLFDDCATSRIPVIVAVNSSGVLPLELLDFNAQAIPPQYVQLKWTTEQEHQLKSFEIERATTGKNWTKIGTIEPSNNKDMSAKNVYKFDDLTAFDAHSTILYYRLRMIDEDGTVRFSPVKTVYLDKLKEAFEVFPNPTKAGVFIKNTSDKEEDMGVELFDVQGQLLLKTSLKVNGTGTYLPLSKNAQKAGIYFMRLSNAGQIWANKRLVVLP
jgi:hypothetical protein